MCLSRPTPILPVKALQDDEPVIDLMSVFLWRKNCQRSRTCNASAAPAAGAKIIQSSVSQELRAILFWDLAHEVIRHPLINNIISRAN